ncbi:glycosyltransferase [Candidatus Cryosericum odellii]|uniref:Glycosyltransferase n=1 Tax=Candidatus Cryosericum odellii TaxID=2290917 RepID=A0A398D0U1_9BACT|nr:glycosyltransferase [Candidatus Cryosericum odellii]RIE08130.1 glycosyltransferase [Candidatus Cryosericum odellii]
MTITSSVPHKTTDSAVAQPTVHRTLFVITGLDYGGAETQVRDVALAFKARGLSVGVVSMLLPVAYQDDLTSAGIHLWSLDMKRKWPDPRMVWRLASIVRQFKPDIVHSHMIHANLLARASRVVGWRKIPLVCTAHNVNEGGRLRMYAYRVTDRWASITTNVSQAAVDRYVAVGAAPAGHIIYMPNGVDMSRFCPDEERRTAVRHSLGLGADGCVILAVARFEEAKNHAGMLRAFARVLETHPSATLLLVGQGTLLNATRTLATTLHVADSVRFLGIRNDIPDLMRASDLYLMSSLWEGLPIVLLEAAASGLPAVATDVGGNPTAVLDGISGRIVSPNDDEALVAAVIEVLNMSPAARRSWGHAARQLAQSSFSLESVADRWLSLYASLIEPPVP